MVRHLCWSPSKVHIILCWLSVTAHETQTQLLPPTPSHAHARTHAHTRAGCPRRNVRDFGRVFLMLKYTNITQNTYVQSRTVTEIIAREKCGLHWSRRTVRRP